MVEACVQVTPALEDLWMLLEPAQQGLPLTKLLATLGLSKPVLGNPRGSSCCIYLKLHQAQKIQSPGFSWVGWFRGFFCEQNSTQFMQYWCKHQPQIISASGQLIIFLAPGGSMPRYFCNSESITFTLYLHWMFKYFCILVTVPHTSPDKCYTCFGWSWA